MGNKDWIYSYNKSLCEQYIKGTDVNYTIVRPYVTYGESRIPFQLIPDGFHYTLLKRIMLQKPVALLDEGSAVCTLTNTVDFANVLYKLLLNKRAYKEAFHITSPFQQSWKSVYELYCELLGSAPKMVSVTKDDIKKYMPECYQSLAGDKGTDWRFDNSKVLDAIGGYEFSVDLRHGLMKSIKFFEEHKEMQGIDYKWEGKMDYMIKHISTYKKLSPVDSTCPSSNSKSNYWVLATPIAHELYMVLWKYKHRGG